MYKKLKGKYIKWIDYGSEGWKPEVYETLEDLFSSEHYNSFTVTKNIEVCFSEKGSEVVSIHGSVLSKGDLPEIKLCTEK